MMNIACKFEKFSYDFFFVRTVTVNICHINIHIKIAMNLQNQKENI